MPSRQGLHLVFTVRKERRPAAPAGLWLRLGSRDAAPCEEGLLLAAVSHQQAAALQAHGAGWDQGNTRVGWSGP